jgi:hypothetical protein
MCPSLVEALIHMLLCQVNELGALQKTSTTHFNFTRKLQSGCTDPHSFMRVAFVRDLYNAASFMMVL